MVLVVPVDKNLLHLSPGNSKGFRINGFDIRITNILVLVWFKGLL